MKNTVAEDGSLLADMRCDKIGNERRRWAYWMIFYELNTTDADQLDAYETFTTR